MVKQGVITPVNEPTNWCSGIVVVPKPNGAIRICVDLTHLNKAVQREIHPMSSVDESLAKPGNSRIFTKLDAKGASGRSHFVLESKLLTTFVTPFCRFCFNRLPFGISSASEIFLKIMSEILNDLEGVICHMDDVLVHALDQATHDQRLREVIQGLHNAFVTIKQQM